MKRIISYFIIALCVLPLHAKERNLEQKIHIAAQFLTNTSYGKLHKVGSAYKMTELKNMEELSVIGYTGGSFAIVTNDDSHQPIIGYSNNSYDLNSPEFAWYLSAANDALKNSLNPVDAQTEPKTKIEPLLETTWGQDTPYNNLCPTERDNESIKYPTGCVATAMAQIMYYHQYPEKGLGSITYSFQDRILSADFNNTTYQWNLMQPTYTKGNYSDESAEAVATLMFQCGASIKMKYNVGGSGAYVYDAATALRKNFGYHENLQVKYRESYTNSEWLSLIYSELQANRPVIYAGSDKNSGGHCFIVDGYDENNFVHVNWGWNGSNDGFYDIALLDPKGYSFSLGQCMLTGVGKPSDDIVYHSEIMSQDNFKVTKLGSTKILITDGTYYNMSDRDFTGELAYVLEGNGEMYVLGAQANVQIPNQYSLTKPSSKTYTLPADLKDGDYRLYAASKDNKDKTWSPVHYQEGNNTCYMLTIKANSVSLSAVVESDWHLTSKINYASGILPFSEYTIVYNLQGQELYKIRPSDFSMDNIPGKGIFIIKQGSKTTKVFK